MRLSPPILLSRTNPRTHDSDQVLEAEAIYAVFYDGKPINLRRVNTAVDHAKMNYQRASHSAPGYAFNLARKLNARHKTDRFTVHAMTAGVRLDQPKLTRRNAVWADRVEHPPGTLPRPPLKPRPG